MATKLHELLAVLSNQETQVVKCRMDLTNTFEKKRHLFEEKKVTFTPSEEGKLPTVEQQSNMESSVVKELEWIAGHMAKLLDTSYRVAEANTRAKADIILDDDMGTVLVKDVPATALLELEKRCSEIMSLLATVPTLDPAKGFTEDKDRGRGMYAAREVTKTRTQKQAKVIVKYEATKEHPAQTELIHVDVPVGTLLEKEWSSLITPAEKANLLDRVEKLNRAVRRARSRANDVEVNQDKKLGTSLLNFILGKVK